MTSRKLSSMAIVLVHGAFVDGSGWESVHDLLREDGYPVEIVQHPTMTLPGDVDATRRVIAAQPGRVVLVGHSYGGVVITEMGSHPRVAGLVYITAFVPDSGESAATFMSDPLGNASLPPYLTAKDGFVVLDDDRFANVFAADIEPRKAAFMAASQVPWGLAALNGTVRDPAWREKPSWYLVATNDHMIPPAVQRSMAKRAGSAVFETSGSHAIYMSQPVVVAALIDKAATHVAAL